MNIMQIRTEKALFLKGVTAHSQRRRIRLAIRRVAKRGWGREELVKGAWAGVVWGELVVEGGSNSALGKIIAYLHLDQSEIERENWNKNRYSSSKSFVIVASSRASASLGASNESPSPSPDAVANWWGVCGVWGVRGVLGLSVLAPSATSVAKFKYMPIVKDCRQAKQTKSSLF